MFRFPSFGLDYTCFPSFRLLVTDFLDYDGTTKRTFEFDAQALNSEQARLLQEHFPNRFQLEKSLFKHNINTDSIICNEKDLDTFQEYFKVVPWDPIFVHLNAKPESSEQTEIKEWIAILADLSGRSSYEENHTLGIGHRGWSGLPTATHSISQFIWLPATDDIRDTLLQMKLSLSAENITIMTRTLDESIRGFDSLDKPIVVSEMSSALKEIMDDWKTRYEC